MGSSARKDDVTQPEPRFDEGIDAGQQQAIRERLDRWLPQEKLAGARIEILAGGAINRNYLVHVDGGYVLRLAPPMQTRTEIGIDMTNSAIVARMAGEAGVGPSVAAVEPATGDSLIEFVPGVLNAGTIRDPQVLREVGATVRALHAVPPGDVRRVSAFDELEEWVGNAVARGVRLPDDYPMLWSAVAQCRSVLDDIEGECLSHRDLNPQNCIRNGGTVKLIDWDFSGVDSPYLDLAMLATYSELDEDQLDIFLSAAIPDYRPEDLSRVQLMRFAHAMREWAWCLSASDVLVDQTHAEAALLPTQASGETNFYDGYREINWRFAEQLRADSRWDSWLRQAASPLPAPGFRPAGAVVTN